MKVGGKFMSAHKEVIRFTFDCPISLHTVAKMKASALHQSMREYLVGLLVKDAMENPPEFLGNKAFKKELYRILEEDEDLMRKLADK